MPALPSPADAPPAGATNFALQHDWRRQIGRPQLFAGLLLLAFLGQCLWLMAHVPLSPMEQAYIQAGQAQLSAGQVAQDATRSPLPSLASALLLPRDRFQRFAFFAWRARLPFLIAGLLLGASLWYVARRLYGNVGGYVALTLFAFTPDMVIRSATVQPVILAAWGAFGAVFTAIAVSHTLYAPREVVLWNWKRILLLGVAIGLAVGAQFALLLLLPVVLAIMLWVVPERRGAALAIFFCGCAVALLLLLAFYSFHPGAWWTALGNMSWGEFMPGLLGRALTWELLARFFLRQPAVTLLLIISLVTFAAWSRPRYFAPAVPLILFALLVVLGIVLPHQGGYNLFVVALPFSILFSAGIVADLLESRFGGIAFGVLLGLLISHVAFSLLGLARVR